MTGTALATWPLRGWNTRGYSYLEQQKDGQRHPGADLNFGYGDQDLGMPIVAFSSGVIVGRLDWVEPQRLGYGNALLIAHPQLALWSLYAHLDDFAPDMHVGAFVDVGQEVGTCGKSGWQSWAHLHWELRYFGPEVMPIDYWGGWLDLESMSGKYADPYTLGRVLGALPAHTDSPDVPAADCSAIEAELALVREAQQRADAIKFQLEHWVSSTPLWERQMRGKRVTYKQVDNAAVAAALIAAGSSN